MKRKLTVTELKAQQAALSTRRNIARGTKAARKALGTGLGAARNALGFARVFATTLIRG